MKKKIILSLIIIMLLCFTSCKKKESEKLEFLEKPLESYVVNTSTNQALENIKIKITNGKKNIIKKASDASINVNGFDLSIIGEHIAKFTYGDKELTWKYFVQNSVWNKNENTLWYNEEKSVFKINNAEELAGLAKLVNSGNDFKNKVILLNSDIDLGGHAWTPIGTSGKGVSKNNEYYFSGVFNGQGHQINNLHIVAEHTKIGEHISSEESYYNAGIFGQTLDATIKNVKINNVTIVNGMMNEGVRSLQGTGALVGYAKGKSIFTNITITGKINIDGEYKVGGIIGNISGNSPVIQGLKIIGTDDSYIYGTDQKYKDTNNFGGIIGFGDVTNAIIDDCCTDIKITGVTSGGIIGSIVGSNITISNCVVYNDVEDLESTVTGGIIGARFTNFTINNCYFLGNVITGANNDYGDVIIGKYGKNVIIDSNNIFYANKNDKIYNSLNAIRQDYQQIIDMLSDNLKIDEND